ncbi:MAG: hypothetical protein K8L97_17655 [Anaerolineae bacterium]|nr:hypothetical protein [Anaerolineae bacterium]
MYLAVHAFAHSAVALLTVLVAATLLDSLLSSERVVVNGLRVLVRAFFLDSLLVVLLILLSLVRVLFLDFFLSTAPEPPAPFLEITLCTVCYLPAPFLDALLYIVLGSFPVVRETFLDLLPVVVHGLLDPVYKFFLDSLPFVAPCSFAVVPALFQDFSLDVSLHLHEGTPYIERLILCGGHVWAQNIPLSLESSVCILYIDLRFPC